MPRRINFEADAVPFRRGNTDYIETSAGRRAVRTFDGANGSWRLSKLGKRFFFKVEHPTRSSPAHPLRVDDHGMRRQAGLSYILRPTNSSS